MATMSSLVVKSNTQPPQLQWRRCLVSHESRSRRTQLSFFPTSTTIPTLLHCFSRKLDHPVTKTPLSSSSAESNDKPIAGPLRTPTVIRGSSPARAIRQCEAEEEIHHDVHFSAAKKPEPSSKPQVAVAREVAWVMVRAIAVVTAFILFWKLPTSRPDLMRVINLMLDIFWSGVRLVVLWRWIVWGKWDRLWIWI